MVEDQCLLALWQKDPVNDANSAWEDVVVRGDEGKGVWQHALYPHHVSARQRQAGQRSIIKQARCLNVTGRIFL